MLLQLKIELKIFSVHIDFLDVSFIQFGTHKYE